MFLLILLLFLLNACNNFPGFIIIIERILNAVGKFYIDLKILSNSREIQKRAFTFKKN